jgi:putative aldouronate transport system permease protein
MFFSGGLIPIYLVVMKLGLSNSIWSVILLHGINTFYLIVVKNYFSTIPESLEEAAKLDGANDIVIFLRIMLPLCKPIFATFLLFYAVDRWNEWFYSMLFIKKSTLIPLQVMLRNMVFVDLYETKDGTYDSMTVFFGEGIKMAAVVLTMAPIMMVYPFLQKYFVKGMMVGAVKE